MCHTDGQVQVAIKWEAHAKRAGDKSLDDQQWAFAGWQLLLSRAILLHYSYSSETRS